MTETGAAQLHAAANTPPRHTLAYAVVVGLFAVWGLAQWTYTSISPQFMQFFQLTPTQATGTQVLFNLTYCLLAVPAALLHRKFGYKLGVIFALSIFSLGPILLYPAITQHGVLYFLGSVIVIGAGWAWLETSINPLIVEQGSRETAVRRLNLAQAFYPLGLLIGYFASQNLIQSNLQLSAGDMAQTVARPYVWVGLAVLLLAFLLDQIKFSPIGIQRAAKGTSARDEFRTLLARPDFRIGAAALCVLILAQSVTWGASFRYVIQELPSATSAIAGHVFLLSCIIFTVGRFAGTALMYKVEPNRLLTWCTGASLILVIGAASIGGTSGLVCLVTASLFMAPMYATIFGTTIRDLGPLTKSGSGLLVAAAGIGAALGPLMDQLVLNISDARALTIVAGPCFLVILAFTAAVRRAQPGERLKVLAPQH